MCGDRPTVRRESTPHRGIAQYEEINNLTIFHAVTRMNAIHLDLNALVFRDLAEPVANGVLRANQ